MLKSYFNVLACVHLTTSHPHSHLFRFNLRANFPSYLRQVGTRAASSSSSALHASSRGERRQALGCSRTFDSKYFEGSVTYSFRIMCLYSAHILFIISLFLTLLFIQISIINRIHYFNHLQKHIGIPVLSAHMMFYIDQSILF